MVTVEIRLANADIAADMNKMRLWLDRLRFEPSTFVSTKQGAETIVLVEFKITDEALAFAEQFAGCILSA